MAETIVWFADYMEKRGIKLSSEQLGQFEHYYEMLIDWNERMNLTGITEREAVYEKHFYDSVSLSFFVDMSRIDSIADIGSGAGFPGIPLKICFPHLKLLIVDSLNKRIGFLQALASKLELSDVELVHGRAEDVALMPQYRDQYALATARAVARLNVLNELCLPFVRKNGYFAAMKGSKSEEEMLEAGYSLKQLHGRVKEQHDFMLPFEQSERHIIVVEKRDATPRKYPRKAGTPAKSPLMQP